MAEPFRVERRGGVLRMTLDTPGSPVNIFDGPAARQVIDEMARAPQRGLRAAVFASGKPESFLNGARLLALCSMREAADSERLGEEIRRAYETVRQSSIPTLAAIRGNCYGCGLEFALACRHRVAADTCDTHFYLTELQDYLVLPAFGAMRFLPGLVGIEAAVELLLHGHRWSAPEAARRGLVDAVFEDAAFDAEVERLVSGMLADPAHATISRAAQPAAWSGLGSRSPAPAPPPGFLARARADVARMPPAYHRLYADCLEVLENAASPRAERLERSRFARHVSAPRVKSAVAFFLVRQAAHALAWRANGAADAIRLRVADPATRDFAADLTERKVRGLTVHHGAHAKGADFSLHVYGARPASTTTAPRHHRESATPVAILHRAPRSPLRWDTPLVLYLHDGRFFELAIRPAAADEAAGPAAARDSARPAAAQAQAARLHHLLCRAGFSGVVSRPVDTLVLAAWQRAWDAPLAAWDGDPDAARAALWRFGFRTPPAVPARPDGRLLDARLISLLGAARRSLQSGALPHPSFADLIARELLDFPLLHGSLCLYLTPQRVRAILHRRKRFAPYVAPVDLEAAAQFAASPRGFYR